MNVSKFVLLSGGNAGIVAESTETVPHGNFSIIDKVKRTRPFPVPTDLLNKIEKLKYFYLNLTRHWMPPFNKYFDLSEYKVKPIEEGAEVPQSYLMMQGLLSNTEIIGISVSNAGFCIMGKIEVVPGKKSAITTPLVTEEDDVSFFMEAMEHIMNIMDSVAGVLSARGNDEIDVARAAEFLKVEEKLRDSLVDSDKLLELIIDKFQERGAIVLQGGPDVELPPEAISDGKDKSTLYTGTGSIDSHNMPVAEHQDDDDGEDDSNEEEEEENDKLTETEEPVFIASSVIEKKPIGKGTLASEKGFPVLDDISVMAVTKTESDIPVGGTLEDFEYSENLGIPREDHRHDAGDDSQQEEEAFDADQTPKEW